MKTVEKYWIFMKTLTTVALLSQNLYYCYLKPGPMDTINGAISGLVIYAIWFAKEKKKPPHLQDYFSDVQE